eukprot:5619930-Prymnesium_polylepis.1
MAWARIVDQQLHQPQRALRAPRRARATHTSTERARGRAQKKHDVTRGSWCALCGTQERTALAKGPGSKPPPRPHAQLSVVEAACSACLSRSIDAIGT